MKINVESPLRTITGAVMRESADPNSPIATLGAISVTALLAESEETVAPIEKYHRFKLAQRIVGGGAVEVTAEEIAMLKNVVGRCFGAAVVGPVFDLLEGQA